MDLDLGLVANFLVLVEEMHYGRAAMRLHMNSSALTKRIQRLERQLGVPLVERDSTGVLAVTSAGRQFAIAAVPLIAQANAALESARAKPARYTLRVGMPVGGGAMLGHFDMTRIAREVRRSFPEIRLVLQEIPFPALTRCLPEHRIDVLWDTAPVHHPAVDSFPLPITSARIGVVAARHPLADAGTMNVEDFSEQPILYNPAAADDEWMKQFWLGDVRPRREARLVEVDADDITPVLRQLGDGTAVMVGVAEYAPRLLGSRLRAVTLTGAAPVVFHVACRRTDRRGAVRALLEAFQAVGPRHFL
ncbi:LysR family transcriptional regulator [Planotetraspora sp. A-T 1434]|uniref:LysR family transcriptional regulator n=1 Tax=Planotetraspora sp. A-T 1434 TaxID=2979219 RepID=UPI0021C233BC|nr:LysR family transcriptional regulator [Planotetraspora sp. A-T 1434]MCT9931668.1 LysR family transcriptional regulator [Planotetraspora sp. A-T 1434]